MRRNITLAIHQQLLKRARGLAAQQGVSISRMLADQLRAMVAQDTAYRLARTRALARDILRDYAAWVHSHITPATVLRASEIGETWRLSFWDSMILAAAEQDGAATLLTEDLSHGQVIAGIKIVNPFA